MSRELKIMPLQPFGLEIDLDLGSPLRDEVVEELKRLYDLHHLLVFRDQRLSHPQQIEFVSHFGPVLSQPDGVGYISNQPGRGGLGDVELAFHSDLAFNEKPFLGMPGPPGAHQKPAEARHRVLARGRLGRPTVF